MWDLRRIIDVILKYKLICEHCQPGLRLMSKIVVWSRPIRHLTFTETRAGPTGRADHADHSIGRVYATRENYDDVRTAGNRKCTFQNRDATRIYARTVTARWRSRKYTGDKVTTIRRRRRRRAVRQLRVRDWHCVLVADDDDSIETCRYARVYVSDARTGRRETRRTPEPKQTPKSKVFKKKKAVMRLPVISHSAYESRERKFVEERMSRRRCRVRHEP